MADELKEIVEQIGLIADRAEVSRWELAQAIADAYTEMPAYSRGLTAGLCSRLAKSTDTIYGLRDGWLLRERILDVTEVPALSVSHFSTLAHLSERYKLTDDEIRESISWAEENSISVRGLAIEISGKHTPDSRADYFRRVQRLRKLLEVLWIEAESQRMGEELRTQTRAVLTGLREWVAAMQEWQATE